MRTLLWSVVAMIAGALPALAFPAPSLWWLAWFGLVPLLLVIRAAPSAWQGALRAWLGLAAFLTATQYWLLPYAGPFLLVLTVLLGAFWAPFGWAAHRLLAPPVTTRRLLVATLVLPSAWVIAEAMRSWHALGGPWALLGASQWNQPATLASASLGGVWLVSFVIVAVNTAITYALSQQNWSSRAVAAGLALICAAIGPAWFVLGPSPTVGRSARIALVQPGNIEDATARQQAGEKLTEALAGRQLDLVVWGESSVGVDLTSHPDVLQDLTELAQRLDTYVLVNVDAPSATGEISKTSVLIAPNGPNGTYRKTRLVPFGEYVPLRPLLGSFTSHTQAAAEDRQRGTGPVVLRAGTLAIGPVISYESTFSDLARRVVELGADLLVYQTSTSSYQGSWAQPQLASKPAVHAAEVGRAAVHAGLSGDSTAFDARGRTIIWRPSGYRGTTVVDVPLTSGATVYQRLGNWVPAFALAIIAIAAGVSWWCGRSRRPSWPCATRWPARSRAADP